MGPRRLRIMSALIAPLLALGGCESPKPNTSAGKEAAKSPATPSTKTAPAAPETKGPQAEPEYFAGAHILVAYTGAMRADPKKVTRTKEQALKLAKELAAQVRKDPSTFTATAQKHSDGPSGPQGGDLGTWIKGRMVPAFDKAIAALKVGEISDPVETRFGYHVMIRKEVPPAEDLAASHIIVAFKGALMARPTVTRDEAAAKKIAEKLRAQAAAKPDTFDALVMKNSDGPRAKTGGALPAWNTRASRMPPIFTEAVRKLKVGEISEIVKSPYGFHVFKRTEPPPTFAGAHVLLAYKGAMRAGPNVKRTKAEAKALAAKLSKQLKADPTKFEEVAAKQSDGPSAARGGRLGKWQKGRMVPAFDKAIETMKIGEVSDPVESAFGIHVIIRQDPAKVQ